MTFDPEKFADAVAKAIETSSAPLLARIKALERRCAELESALALKDERIKKLEQRPQGLVDRGVWDDALLYEKGDVVSHQGGMWIAQESSRSKRPGLSPSWRLAVHRGKEGKPGPPARSAV